MTRRRVLLCGTEAGGVANLAPLVSHFHEEDVDLFVMTSECFARRFAVSPSRMTTDVGVSAVQQFMQHLRPDVIVHGTTRFDSVDRRMPEIAAQAGARSIAVLDERYLYRARFEDAAGRVTRWPDLIAVMDEEAREEALVEGVPGDRLRVTGSPALSELVHSVEEFGRNAPPWPAEILPERPDRVVTFVSETIAEDYGRSPDSPGRMGAFVGYTEQSVLGLLVDALGASDLSITIVDKRHPADESILPQPEQRGLVRILPVRSGALWSLLWHSDAVIGMRSMALLEAAILGVPVLSFQPGLVGPERCTGVRLGVVQQTSDTAVLRAWLTSMLREPRPRRALQRGILSFADPEAARRIVRLSLGGDA